jgi:hypothetical protein
MSECKRKLVRVDYHLNQLGDGFAGDYIIPVYRRMIQDERGFFEEEVEGLPFYVHSPRSWKSDAAKPEVVMAMQAMLAIKAACEGVIIRFFEGRDLTQP